MREISYEGLKYVDGNHAYYLDGKRIPGISTIAKVGGSAQPLIAWAYRIGRDGALQVIKKHYADSVADLDPRELDTIMAQERQTPWTQRSDAADRGNAVHDALERLAQDEEPPDITKYPAEERGHVRALLKWYLDFRPSSLAVEVIVASRKHKFAGRYDVNCTVKWGKLVDYADEVAGFPADVPIMVDLKTSKRVYIEHFAQLAGYEGAGVEMGYPATWGQFVLNTHKDGTYEFVKSPATFKRDFLPRLGVYKSNKALETAMKNQER